MAGSLRRVQIGIERLGLGRRPPAVSQGQNAHHLIRPACGNVSTSPAATARGGFADRLRIDPHAPSDTSAAARLRDLKKACRPQPLVQALGVAAFCHIAELERSERRKGVVRVDLARLVITRGGRGKHLGLRDSLFAIGLAALARRRLKWLARLCHLCLAVVLALSVVQRAGRLWLPGPVAIGARGRPFGRRVAVAAGASVGTLGARTAIGPRRAGLPIRGRCLGGLVRGQVFAACRPSALPWPVGPADWHDPQVNRQ